jgi:uncharacterized membrane protein
MMTATTVAPAPWPRCAAAAAVPRYVAVAVGGSDAGESSRVEWLLKRNCSITPRQLIGVYLSLCALSLVIALGFAWAGATPVLAFAGVELLAVGAALLLYARHAADGERIVFAGGAVSVEHRCGSRTARSEFRAAWLRVEPPSSDRSLIELAGEGRRTLVGRYVRPEWRPALARELRAALEESSHPNITRTR